MYSRMDQVKFVEDRKGYGLQRLSSKNFTWSILEYLDPNAVLPFFRSLSKGVSNVRELRIIFCVGNMNEISQ